MLLKKYYLKAGISIVNSKWYKVGEKQVVLATMTEPRYAAASAVIRDDDIGEDLLWITGGATGMGWLKMSEYISLRSGSNAGPDLPEMQRNHCLVKIADAPIVMMANRKTFFFNLETKSWSLGKPLPHRKYLCSCGTLIRNRKWRWMDCYCCWWL